MTAGRYEALVHALDAGVHFTAVACPKLVPLIEAGDAATTAAVQGTRSRSRRPAATR